MGVCVCVRAGADAEVLVPPEHRHTYLGVIDRLPDIMVGVVYP